MSVYFSVEFFLLFFRKKNPIWKMSRAVRHVPVFLSFFFRVFANYKQENHQRNELVLCCQHKESHIYRMGWKKMQWKKKSKQCERKNKMYNCILKVDHIVCATKCVVYIYIRILCLFLCQRKIKRAQMANFQCSQNGYNIPQWK